MKRILLLMTALWLMIFCASMAAAAEVAIRGYVQGEGFQYLNLGEYPQSRDGQPAPLLWRALYL
ncbi:MAG: hypothetical protein IH607_00015, partial [Firmicutes bacterium]|nr:hypothetical protein [Bacillota bacterium]